MKSTPTETLVGEKLLAQIVAFDGDIVTYVRSRGLMGYSTPLENC